MSQNAPKLPKLLPDVYMHHALVAILGLEHAFTYSAIAISHRHACAATSQYVVSDDRGKITTTNL